MADNGRWFKLWCSSVGDPHLDNLDIADFGRWAKLGAYIKEHGTEGIITLSEPSRKVVSMLQLSSFKDVISCIAKFPHVTVSPVTNATVSFLVKYENWHKYQGDFSTDRVHRFRAKKLKNETPKKRREEKRRNPLPPLDGKALEMFNRFWNVYPKKKSKGDAEKAFRALNPDEPMVESMISKVKELAKTRDWLKDNGQFIPHPASWINSKGWEDEVIRKAWNEK